MAGITGLYIKIWNVRASDWSDNVDDTPWTNEMTRVDQPITPGDALVQCTPVPEELGCETSSSNTTPASATSPNKGALAGAIIALLVVTAAAAAMAFEVEAVSMAAGKAVASFIEQPAMHAVVCGCESSLALFAFAFWASEDTGPCGCDGTSDFFLAAGVLIWLYALAMMCMLVSVAMECDFLSENGNKMGAAGRACLQAIPAGNTITAVFAALAVAAAAQFHPSSSKSEFSIALLFFCAAILIVSAAIQLRGWFCGSNAADDDMPAEGAFKKLGGREGDDV